MNRFYEEQIKETKTVFDFRFNDEPETHKFQIELPKNKDDKIDHIYPFVEECFLAELIQLYINSHEEKISDTIGFNSLEKAISNPTKYLDALNYQYSQAKDKSAFLTMVEQNILKPQKSFSNGMKVIEQTHHKDKFEDDIEEWLLATKRACGLNNITNPINGALPKIKEAKHYIGAEILFKIHKEFKDEIWEEINNMEFLSVFDTNNPIKRPNFRIKARKMTDFYALLWKIHTFVGSDKQGDFIKPLLERYGGSAGSFDNIKATRIENKSKASRKLMNRIDQCLT
ncbi:hypothetical protein [Rubrolithibacter danxiaensis]|uniref:hypothetical protein n=1 Tax=Rubrolithibacter danxiaensis TaxID=3390805 RepID=UPI003BF8E9FE